MEKIALLGSTGSIGNSSIEVLVKHLDRFKLEVLTTNTNTSLLLKQCKDLQPKYVFVKSKEASLEFKSQLRALSLKTVLLDTEQELMELISSSEVNTVIAGMMGIAGLNLIYRSIEAGKKILLANKEAYIVAGELLNELAAKNQATIFPLDSEHSAIHQCILSKMNSSNNIKKLYLTGSGGPFLDKDIASFSLISPEEALAHPIWKMGKKISVDSATMMNKGLELIEARWLFNINPEDIKILIHPEGIIHSMVEYIDGSVISQLSIPDMKIPIAYGLGYPIRIESGVKEIDFHNLKPITFRDPDLTKFPSINLARQAIDEGGTLPAILNAANEEGVKSFLAEEIGFTQIMEIVSSVINTIGSKPIDGIEDVFESDLEARKEALKVIKSLNGNN